MYGDTDEHITNIAQVVVESDDYSRDPFEAGDGSGMFNEERVVDALPIGVQRFGVGRNSARAFSGKQAEV